MPTPGFFQSSIDPYYCYGFSMDHYLYVQSEITRRLRLTYIEPVEVPIIDIKTSMEREYHLIRGAPLSINDLMEKIIESFVESFHTEFLQQRQFANFDPMTLYFPGTGITREERVKLKPTRKFEFQMNY